MKKLIISLSCIMLFLISHGQENETPGFILKHDGDTLRGFIDYRNWHKQPSILSFKVNKTDNYQSYSPADIIGYGVENEIYKSASVDTEVSPDGGFVLNDDSYITTIPTSVFLQELVRGEKSLYYFINHLGKYQFYVHHDNLFELLIYKRHYKKVKDEYIIVSNNQFHEQLLNYMNDCYAITKRIARAQYTSSDLKHIFINYHSCTERAVDYNKKGKRLKLEAGILAGAYSTSLDFNRIGKAGEIALNRDNLNFYKDFHPEDYISFTPGIFLDIIWPYGGKKWSIRNELTYSTYKSSGYVEYKDYNTGYTINFDQSNVRLNNLVRYKHPMKSFNVFFNLGVANTLTSKNTDRTYKIDLYSEKVLESVDAFKNLTGNFAFLFGAGASYKNLSMEYRIERFRNKSADTYIEKRLNTNHVILSYKIGFLNSKTDR